MYETVQKEIGDRISPDDILCAQYYDRSWIIYTTGQVAKARILSVANITVHGKTFQLSEFGKDSIRISIHGIPMHISDKEVQQWVDSFAIRTTEVQKHDILVKHDSKTFKTLYSGHRFCYASQITKDLPRFTSYGISNPMKPTELISIDVAVYFNNQTINCKHCKDINHKSEKCPMMREKQNERKCFICAAPGHISSNCDGGRNILPFCGERNKLSNFSPCELKIGNKTFISSEQYWQWRKACAHKQMKIAEDILCTSKPWEAKKLGDRISESKAWKANKLAIMAETLDLKMEQSNDSRAELLKSGEKTLAECTRDPYWGTGLSREDTLKTPPTEWPGENALGKLLTTLRAKLGHPDPQEEKDSAVKLVRSITEPLAIANTTPSASSTTGASDHSQESIQPGNGYLAPSLGANTVDSAQGGAPSSSTSATSVSSTPTGVTVNPTKPDSDKSHETNLPEIGYLATRISTNPVISTQMEAVDLSAPTVIQVVAPIALSQQSVTQVVATPEASQHSQVQTRPPPGSGASPDLPEQVKNVTENTNSPLPTVGTPSAKRKVRSPAELEQAKKKDKKESKDRAKHSSGGIKAFLSRNGKRK